MENKRIQYLDLAKGLCIILVVLYHIFIHLHERPQAIRTLPVFMMPLFFFLSGLFFKEYESFWGFFLRKVNKILIPFAFFYLFTSFALPNILHLCGYTVSNTQSLGISGLWAFITEEQFSNNPIWFLWALFLMNIYFYAILTFKTPNFEFYSRGSYTNHRLIRYRLFGSIVFRQLLQPSWFCRHCHVRITFLRDGLSVQ